MCFSCPSAHTEGLCMVLLHLAIVLLYTCAQSCAGIKLLLCRRRYAQYTKSQDMPWRCCGLCLHGWLQPHHSLQASKVLHSKEFQTCCICLQIACRLRSQTCHAFIPKIAWQHQQLCLKPAAEAASLTLCLFGIANRACSDDR